jgi:hypothetical protein
LSWRVNILFRCSDNISGAFLKYIDSYFTVDMIKQFHTQWQVELSYI